MATERQSQLTVGALPLTIRGHSPSRSERVGEDPNGFFYQHADLDRIWIERRLNVNRCYNVGRAWPGGEHR